MNLIFGILNKKGLINMAKDKAIQVRTSLEMHNQILEVLKSGETVGEFIRESIEKNLKNRSDPFNQRSTMGLKKKYTTKIPPV